MKEITSYEYRKHSIKISVSEGGKFFAKCPRLNINSINESSAQFGCDTMMKVQSIIEFQIDSFLQSSITCIDSLASEINNKLTFDVYDGAEINPDVLKNILLQCSPDFLTLHKY